MSGFTFLATVESVPALIQGDRATDLGNICC
jgi:hypothetical protein